MEVIIPCAGASTRFPNTKPKYLLGDYKAKLMVEHVIDEYIDKFKVHMVILFEHEQEYQVSETIKQIYGNKVNVIILPNKTRGPADTVYQSIKSQNILGSILVRDCDSFFTQPISNFQNTVYVAALSEYPDVRNPAAKSYVISNTQNIISTIVEKQIVSDYFCVGGYQFADSKDFLIAYENLFNSKKEPFVSDCIEYLITSGHVFQSCPITNYIDVGTQSDWLDFNNRPTLFCDIDGTLIENQDFHGKNNYFTEPVILKENVEAIHTAINKGCQIIFTTARREKYREVTEKLLNKLGFNEFQLIMNLNHAKRIVINDYAPTNPYPCAVAINLPRNTSQLMPILKSIIKA